jgi:ribosomal protein S7
MDQKNQKYKINKIKMGNCNKFNRVMSTKSNLLVKDLSSTNENFFISSFIFKKFVSQIMKNGKKFKSEKILKNILVAISLKGYSPYSTLVLAINNVKPIVDTRTIRRKGKKFRVPVLLKNSRQITKAIQTI